MRYTLVILFGMIPALVHAAPPPEYLEMKQVVTNGAAAVEIVVPVADAAEATNLVAVYAADADLFGVNPPDAELAYEARHHVHPHNINPALNAPCPTNWVASHASKKTGLKDYVELTEDNPAPTNGWESIPVKLRFPIAKNGSDKQKKLDKFLADPKFKNRNLIGREVHVP